jgi:hypothetical protein
MRIQEKIWIGTFILLWVIVSTVSTIHSVAFFQMSNNIYLSWSLAIAFEIGAMASLGGILISRGNKTLIWGLFIILTLFQIHGNMYWAWINATDITEWSKLFDLLDEDENFRKRIFVFISGGILPLVSLGFIKSLIDYLKIDTTESVQETIPEQSNIETIQEPIVKPILDTVQETIPEQSNIETIQEPIVKPILDTVQETISEQIDNIESTQEPIVKPLITEQIDLDTVNDMGTKDEKPKTKSNKLKNIINKAEKTVNSIGEK